MPVAKLSNNSAVYSHCSDLSSKVPSRFHGRTFEGGTISRGTIYRRQQIIVKSFLGYGLLLFFLIQPVYNYVVFNVADSPRIVGIRLTDLYLLVWMCVFGLVLLSFYWRSLMSDKYILLSGFYIAYCVLRDTMLGVQGYVDYVPVFVLNLTIYGVAAHTYPRSYHFGIAAKWGIVFYTFFAVLQVLGGPVAFPGRINSIFQNPNFFAFYLFHMIVLLQVTQKEQSYANIVWVVLATVGIVVSKTFSVLLLMPILILSIALYNRQRMWYGRVAYSIILGFTIICCFMSLDKVLDTERFWSLSGRLSLWQTVQEKAEVDLLWGGGTDVIKSQELAPIISEGRVVGYCQPQNHYFLIVAETGVVGLLLWSCAIGYYLKAVWPRRSDRTQRIVLIYVLILLLQQIVECDIFLIPVVPAIMGFGVARLRGTKTPSA